MVKALEYCQKKFSCIVSTDVVGFLGRPKNAKKFWEDAFGTTKEFGVEVIGFKNHLRYYRKDLDAIQGQIAGFHARNDLLMHPKSPELIMRPVNASMYHPNDLIEYAKNIDHPTYINVHNLLLSNTKIKDNKFDQVSVYCENDNRPGSALEAVTLAKVYDGLIFDIVHWCVEKNNSQTKNWEKYLDASLDYLDTLGPCFVHISWGWHKKDALPENISTQFLKKLASIIKINHSMPVVECQWGLLHGSIGCNPVLDPKKTNNAKLKIAKLQETGIISKI